jgi:cytoskeleton protein RodZ
MASIGEMLRAEREAQGRSLADLATELCVMQSYLRAIEDNDVASLPGSFFFLSFARQYAAVLGLDRAQVGSALAAIADIADKPTETGAEKLMEARSDLRSPVGSSLFQFSSRLDTSHQASPVRSLDPIVEDTNRRYFRGPLGLSWAGLLAAVLAGSGIFAWWTRPPQTVRAAPAPAKVVLQSGAGVATGGPESRTPEVPLGETRGTDAVPVADGVSLQVAASQVAADQLAASVDDGKQVTLNLSATERTWLSITSHGKVIFSGVLEPSQTKTLQGSEVATMKVGNAGGVDVQWNGKSIGPIGARGQVRTIRFTRENFQFLEPESPDQL